MVESSTVVLFANADKILKNCQDEFKFLYENFALHVERVQLDYPLDVFKLQQHLCMLQKLENATFRLQNLLQGVRLLIENSKSNVQHELSIDMVTPKKMSKKLKNMEKRIPEQRDNILFEALQESELL